MQNTDTRTKKGILLNFDLKERRFNMNLVDIHEDSDYKTFRKLIDSDLIDVAEYNEEIDIIVDDEGLLVSGNPVVEIKTQWGSRPLAGKLLFLKKEERNDGIKNVGLSTGEAFKLVLELQDNLKILGVTR